MLALLFISFQIKSYTMHMLASRWS